MNRGAQRLGKWLEQHGATQADLATKIAKLTRGKVNQSSISAWARGDRIPSGLHMAALRTHCGIEINDWLISTAEQRSRTGTDGG